MSPENQIQDRMDQMSGVSECYKCKGSGQIAISVTTATYLFPGPVPEDARGVAAATCYVCKGCGYVEDGDE